MRVFWVIVLLFSCASTISNVAAASIDERSIRDEKVFEDRLSNTFTSATVTVTTSVCTPTPTPTPTPKGDCYVCGGVTYVRWGRTACPDTEGTELVYNGTAAASASTNRGGGANYQCLPDDPENFAYNPGSVDDHNVPCAVCYVATRVALLMIPGKYTCPPSWTREYYGWLMGARNRQHRSTYECVDASPQIIPGGQAAEPGARFSNVEPRCGILPCPPYDPEKELSCVVCTR